MEPPRRNPLVRQPSTPWRKALERWVRIIQGNFDHFDGVIQQVNKAHNALDDNVQELTEFVNDNLQAVATDAEEAIAALPAVITDHGGLSGLGDDDHPQYLTEAEGDAAYADISEPIAAAHIGDTGDAHDASAVSIVDAGNYFTGTEVEAALQELGAAGGGGSDGSDHDILDHADANTSPSPTADDVLTWDGAEWVAAAPSGGAPAEIVWVFASKVHPETGIGRAMYAPYDATIIRAYAWCTDSAPTSTMTADILLVGVSIGGTKPTVTSGNYLGAEVSDMVTTAVTQYDKLEVEIESTGSADGRIFVAVVVNPV